MDASWPDRQFPLRAESVGEAGQQPYKPSWAKPPVLPQRHSERKRLPHPGRAASPQTVGAGTRPPDRPGPGACSPHRGTCGGRTGREARSAVPCSWVPSQAAPEGGATGAALYFPTSPGKPVKTNEGALPGPCPQGERNPPQRQGDPPKVAHICPRFLLSQTAR